MKITGRQMLIFRQLFEEKSSTYTYILGCENTKKAIIIDPVIETAERDAKLIRELHLDPIYAINTHVHADHITGTHELKKYFPEIRSVLRKEAGGEADIYVEDGQVLRIGEEDLEIRATPGHTNGCSTFVSHKNRIAFTGDALLIRGCGRTDFQQGSPHTLYNSVWDKILSLPDDYMLYVGHNYQGILQTSVKEEKEHNPRLTKTEEEFVNIMNNLKLPYPKQIDRAVPANMKDGDFRQD